MLRRGPDTLDSEDKFAVERDGAAGVPHGRMTHAALDQRLNNCWHLRERVRVSKRLRPIRALKIGHRSHGNC